ncbi:MAG: hypothetical protein L0229_02635 [Blastocatellia bacterium]|nr:hypothetical protein [Blastocatellia bacterium]
MPIIYHKKGTALRRYIAKSTTQHYIYPSRTHHIRLFLAIAVPLDEGVSEPLGLLDIARAGVWIFATEI